MYSKFIFIRQNFINANIREFDQSRTQNSHEISSYIGFT